MISLFWGVLDTYKAYPDQNSYIVYPQNIVQSSRYEIPVYGLFKARVDPNLKSGPTPAFLLGGSTNMDPYVWIYAGQFPALCLHGATWEKEEFVSTWQPLIWGQLIIVDMLFSGKGNLLANILVNIKMAEDVLISCHLEVPSIIIISGNIPSSQKLPSLCYILHCTGLSWMPLPQDILTFYPTQIFIQ